MKIVENTSGIAEFFKDGKYVKYYWKTQSSLKIMY